MYITISILIIFCFVALYYGENKLSEVFRVLVHIFIIAASAFMAFSTDNVFISIIIMLSFSSFSIVYVISAVVTKISSKKYKKDNHNDLEKK